MFSLSVGFCFNNLLFFLVKPIAFKSNIGETTEVKTVTMVAEIAPMIDDMEIVTVAIGEADMAETVTTIAEVVIVMGVIEIATADMAENATMIAEGVIATMIAEGVIATMIVEGGIVTMIAEGVIDTMIAVVATVTTIVEVEIGMVTEIEGVTTMTAREAHGVTLTVVAIQGATLIGTRESLVREKP